MAAVAALASGCKDDTPDDPCGEPIYGGAATDEAWRTMVDGEARATADAKAPSFTAPTEAQTFTATDSPPVVSWTSPLALAPRSPSNVVPASRTAWARVLGVLGSLVEGTAEAHLPPITGSVYFLHFDIAGRTCPYNVLTTNLDWQIDAAGWAAMKAATPRSAISIRIVSAYLTENRITEGPFKPAVARTFKIQ